MSTDTGCQHWLSEQSKGMALHFYDAHMKLP